MVRGLQYHSITIGLTLRITSVANEGLPKREHIDIAGASFQGVLIM